MTRTRTSSWRSRLCALLLATSSLTGCATISGTAVSPITGGVDLIRETMEPRHWYWMPFVFIGGAVAGPFVAFYNGVTYDPTVFRGFGPYWRGFEDVFRPFHMVRKGTGQRAE